MKNFYEHNADSNTINMRSASRSSLSARPSRSGSGNSTLTPRSQPNTSGEGASKTNSFGKITKRVTKKLTGADSRENGGSEILPDRSIDTIGDLNAYIITVTEKVMKAALKKFDFKKAVEKWNSDNQDKAEDETISDTYKASVTLAKLMETECNKKFGDTEKSYMAIPKHLMPNTSQEELNKINKILQESFVDRLTSCKQLGQKGSKPIVEIACEMIENGKIDNADKFVDGFFGYYKTAAINSADLIRSGHEDNKNKKGPGMYWNLDIYLSDKNTQSSTHARVKQDITNQLKKSFSEKTGHVPSFVNDLYEKIFKEYPFVAYNDYSFAFIADKIADSAFVGNTDEEKINSIVNNDANKKIFAAASIKNTKAILAVLDSPLGVSILPQAFNLADAQNLPLGQGESFKITLANVKKANENALNVWNNSVSKNDSDSSKEKGPLLNFKNQTKTINLDDAVGEISETDVFGDSKDSVAKTAGQKVKVDFDKVYNSSMLGLSKNINRTPENLEKVKKDILDFVNRDDFKKLELPSIAQKDKSIPVSAKVFSEAVTGVVKSKSLGAFSDEYDKIRNVGEMVGLYINLLASDEKNIKDSIIFTREIKENAGKLGIDINNEFSFKEVKSEVTSPSKESINYFDDLHNKFVNKRDKSLVKAGLSAVTAVIPVIALPAILYTGYCLKNAIQASESDRILQESIKEDAKDPDNLIKNKNKADKVIERFLEGRDVKNFNSRKLAKVYSDVYAKVSNADGDLNITIPQDAISKKKSWTNRLFGREDHSIDLKEVRESLKTKHVNAPEGPSKSSGSTIEI